jgi:putative Holliday junction resolvase
MQHDNRQTNPATDEMPAKGAGVLDLAAFRAALAPGQRLIGIDVGSKTLGLALSDVGRTIASGLDTIRRRKLGIDAAALRAHIEALGVGGLVIGLPLNLDGSEGPRAQSTRAFARNLSRLAPLPMLLWDERLSTAAAERTLIESDASRRRRAEVIDKMAATIIQQTALDRLRRAD